MKHFTHAFRWSKLAGTLCLFLWCAVPALWCSGRLGENETDDAELVHATDLIRRGLLDSARNVLIPLYDCLAESDSLASPRGIRVRQRMAYVFKATIEEERALAVLLPLIRDTERGGYFAEQAHALLTLAAVYQGSGQAEKCRRTLLACHQLIRQHGLRTLLAWYAIRTCSYFTWQQQLDSVRHYAHLALEQSTSLRQEWEQAHAYTLLNDAYPDSSYLFYVANLQRFAAYQRKVENYTELAAAYEIMGIYYLGNDKVATAKRLSDSTFLCLAAMERRGQSVVSASRRAHGQRMKVFEVLGQPDSALYHAKRAAYFQEVYNNQRSLAAIREIEAKYADTAKADKIRQQGQQLGQKRKQQALLLLILALIGSSALLLYYFNQKLARVNRSLTNKTVELERLNHDLAQSLEHEELLRGELHHRVKNNLQVIISMLDLQEANTDNPGTKRSVQAMSERIFSIATVHELLSPRESIELIDFSAYLDKLCRHAAEMWPAEQQPEFRQSVPPVSFNIDTLVPLGIVISELMTNTRKYFYNRQTTPRIQITLRVRRKELYLEYLDNGPGFAAGEMPARPGGLGKYLLQGMSRQLNGRCETFSAGGAGTRIYFQPKNMDLHVEEGEYNLAGP